MSTSSMPHSLTVPAYKSGAPNKTEDSPTPQKSTLFVVASEDKLKYT